MSEAPPHALLFSLGAVSHAVWLVRRDLRAGGLTLSALVSLIGLFPGRNERDYDLSYHLVYSALIFCVMIAVTFRRSLLPRVNEKILLAYTLAFWYAFLVMAYEPDWWFWKALAALFALPSLGVLWLGVSSRPLGFGLKLGFYAWYLVLVISMVLFQFTYGYLLPFFSSAAPADGSGAGAFLGGMAFCYMVINGTYLYQMLPFRRKRESEAEARRRWKEWTDLMTGRYDDSCQLCGWQSLSIVAILGGALAANYSLGFADHVTLVNLSLLVPLALMPSSHAPPLDIKRDSVKI
ncbi:MAG: hypothetical protein RDU13_07925 [Elusimicrobiales bacterium]|nr:hypothetical protein [Elusimicrobiales bacterium]